MFVVLMTPTTVMPALLITVKQDPLVNANVSLTRSPTRSLLEPLTKLLSALLVWSSLLLLSSCKQETCLYYNIVYVK